MFLSPQEYNDFEAYQLSLFSSELGISKEKENWERNEYTRIKEKEIQYILSGLIPYTKKEVEYGRGDGRGYIHYGYIDLVTLSCCVEIKDGKHGELGLMQALKILLWMIETREKDKTCVIYLYNHGDGGRPHKKEGKRKDRTGMTANEKVIKAIISLLSRLFPNLILLTERIGHEEEDRKENVKRFKELDLEYLSKQKNYNDNHNAYLSEFQRKENAIKRRIERI